jgi:2-dehydro-3-deoxygluconokinase
MPSTRIVCFGELLLRLSAPGRELLLQSPQLDVCIGGAEANVAVALARFGHPAAMVSVVPRNEIGEAAVGELRRHGVDTTAVAAGPGRMGLYFLQTGAIHRPSQVLYDRAHSAFASAQSGSYDWPRLLAGARALVVSGVTPALGDNAATAAVAAVREAHERGLHVVFDGNFRSKLWQAWDGDPQRILHAIFACADTLFADQRDIAIVLGRDFSGEPPEHVFAVAASAAFDAFPQLKRIAATSRVQHNVDHHELCATLITRSQSYITASHHVSPIIDRIGAGDAFAAGVLHGLFSGKSEQESLEFGLAAGCLKHSVPGDFLRLGENDIVEFLGERRFDVRR